MQNGEPLIIIIIINAKTLNAPKARYFSCFSKALLLSLSLFSLTFFFFFENEDVSEPEASSAV